YPYHIHQLPIKNDDCDSAGGHWDPTNKNPNDKNENYKCTSAKVEACQHGDLSGKHGKLKGRNNSRFTIIDDQIKIKGKLSVINKSIVIHYPADKRRLICGTI
ncbi:Cu,Zn superoxide dismutase-like protein, partial [Neoconidiobolus thromboides FSU 785]